MTGQMGNQPLLLFSSLATGLWFAVKEPGVTCIADLQGQCNYICIVSYRVSDWSLYQHDAMDPTIVPIL